MILMPLRLGLDGLQAEYIPAVQRTFSFPQSVGIIGGKRAHSVYFVGSQVHAVLYSCRTVLVPYCTQTATWDHRDRITLYSHYSHLHTVQGSDLHLLDPHFTQQAIKFADHSYSVPVSVLLSLLLLPLQLQYHSSIIAVS
jgi:cysteine protease ATG4